MPSETVAVPERPSFDLILAAETKRMPLASKMVKIADAAMETTATMAKAAQLTCIRRPSGVAGNRHFLIKGQTWARVAGMILAGISALLNFVWLPYSPWWALLIIGIDILVIWALANYHRQPAPQGTRAAAP
jgi:hypothetical protein